MKTEETKKQLNLFGKLTKDSNSLFYSVEKINRNLLNKARKSVYEKDNVFYKLYNEIENADIGNINFLSKSAADPHYCLLCVDLFSSKLCTYSMRKRSLLAKKWSSFMKKLKQKKIVKNV